MSSRLMKFFNFLFDPDILKIVIAGVLIAIGGFFYFKAEILTLQLDQQVLATKVAEGQRDAQRRLRIAEVTALENARKEDHDRQKFTLGNQKSIERGRKTGDGRPAPVLVDTGERLRDRYKEFNKRRDP